MTNESTIGVLHPGKMGVSIAAAASGRRIWASADRSPETSKRAEAAGLEDVGTVMAMTREADLIVSVCPPEAAEAVAGEVAATGFAGIYVDANAISPASSRRIGDRFGRYVDGSIVGGPVTPGSGTWLYLAGEEAESAAGWWEGSPLRTEIIGAEPGKASALKAAYAAWTKGSAALLLTARALAVAEGVEEELVEQWQHSIPELVARSDRTAGRVAPKAWRYQGEMEEIANALHAAGLPAGFHEAAAEAYSRLAPFKGEETASLEQVLAALLSGREE